MLDIHGALRHMIGIDYKDIEAEVFEDVIADIFEQEGATVKKQVFVPDRYDGRRGKVDLVIEKGRERIGMEIDCGVERKKSIFKLTHMPNITRAFIVLRSPFSIREICQE